MRRRLAILVIAVSALTTAPVAAEALIPDRATSGGYWGCVGTIHIDFGLCIGNPLPERLPQVEAPSVSLPPQPI